jgi:outer membrane protein
MRKGKTGKLKVAFFSQRILSLKRKVRERYLIIGVCMVWGIFAPVKTVGQSSMNLSQCIDYALVHHPDVLSAHLDEEIALQNVRQVAATGYPQINAYGSFDDNIRIPLVALPAIFFDQTAPADAIVPVRFGVQYTGAAYAQLDQIIYMGTYWIGLKASKVSRVYYCQSSQQVIENTIYNVCKAYFNYLVSVQRVEVQKSNLEKSQNLFQIVDLQYQNDVATKADRDRVFVDYNNQLTELKTLERAVKASLNQLKFQMGMPVSEQVEIVSVNADTSTLFQLEELPEKPNYWKRADYKLMQTRRELGALQVKQYTSEFQPQLTAFGKYQYQSFSEKFNLWKTEWFNSQVVGLRLTVPIFSGFKRSAQVQQYKLELKKLEIGIARLEQQIDIELSNAMEDFNTSVDNIKLASENIKLAQLVYDSEILSYKEGVGAYSDFLNATNSLKVAQVNYVTSLFNAYLARLELAKAQGKLNEVIKWIGK